MAEVASPSQPQRIPSAGLNVATPRNNGPPNSLPIPSQARSFRQQQLTPLDTFSPVTQHGSFEFDRIIKQGEVHKRTRKTKVCHTRRADHELQEHTLRPCHSRGSPSS